MAIQPIGSNHKAANLAILSYQIDLHTIYSVEWAPWRVPQWVNAVMVHSRYTKRKYLHCYVLSQKFFYCVTPMPRKWEETLCPVPKENHANASWNASWTCRVSPVPQKKNWKAMTQHQSLLRELAHQIWVRVFFGLLNRLHMLCHCFSELWSFFPFSSETLDWHCRYTFVITHINAITFFLCIFNGSKQHLLTFHLCHSPLCLLNWIGGVQIYLIW